MKENVKERYNKLFETLSQENSTFDKNNDQLILIIDGTNTFMRCISVNTTISEAGLHIGGLTGFLTSVGYAIKTLRPNRIVIVFDGQGGSLKRKELFKEYKSQRNPRKTLVTSLFGSKVEEAKAISFEMNRLALYLKALPVQTMVIDNIEADDTIAFLCTDIFESQKKIIMSSDRDFYQLINTNTSIWSPTKKKLYRDDEIIEEFGIHAINFIIYKILSGDTSDNIPGVKGVGLKTIIKNFPFITENNKITIDQLLEYCEKYNKLSKANKKISESKEQLILNYRLMQLENVNIADFTKIIISNAINQPITRLNKFRLQKLILEDMINSQIKDFEGWIKSTWWFLDLYAKELNKIKTE